MAEAYFKDHVTKQGLRDQFFIDSAGMGAWHTGKGPHQGTRKKLDEQNISYQGIKARQVKMDDLDNFNYIIAMDDQNLADLAQLSEVAPQAKVAKLLDFVDHSAHKNVPDPYFTGDFDQTFQLVEQGCLALLLHIKQELNLS